jgi:hypothetical protein
MFVVTSPVAAVKPSSPLKQIDCDHRFPTCFEYEVREVVSCERLSDDRQAFVEVEADREMVRIPGWDSNAFNLNHRR